VSSSFSDLNLTFTSLYSLRYMPSPRIRVFYLSPKCTSKLKVVDNQNHEALKLHSLLIVLTPQFRNAYHSSPGIQRLAHRF